MSPHVRGDIIISVDTCILVKVHLKYTILHFQLKIFPQKDTLGYDPTTVSKPSSFVLLTFRILMHKAVFRYTFICYILKFNNFVIPGILGYQNPGSVSNYITQYLIIIDHYWSVLLEKEVKMMLFTKKIYKMSCE